MNVAIIGTRGIPNRYGGFEQFAEYLSQYLVTIGHQVTVYSSHTHPYRNSNWNGVRIVHKYDPEKSLGTIGQFVYDFNCIYDCRRRQYDIILQLGYTSNSIWGWLLPKSSVIVTNMDGLEWKRSKYSRLVQKFLQYAEKLAIRYSDYLISDSIGIQKYLSEKYSICTEYIPYGANAIFESDPEVLHKYFLVPFEYNLLIARLEPENNIEIILEGSQMASRKLKFVLIGDHQTKYGKYLKSKFKSDSNILFFDSIYDIRVLNNLRFFSKNYFHGHTVGGTNPSLLEAMASGALVCAHDNIFNKSILDSNGYYFKTPADVARVMDTTDRLNSRSEVMISKNLDKIMAKYSWDNINRYYVEYLSACLDRFRNDIGKLSQGPFSSRLALRNGKAELGRIVC